MNIDGYLTAEQIAQRLGFKRGSTVHRYRVRGDFPPPDDYFGRTPLWTEAAVDRWAQQRPSATWKRKERRPADAS
jgi:predicted DNA-binding transcriptional regulator AlpA